MVATLVRIGVAVVLRRFCIVCIGLCVRIATVRVLDWFLCALLSCLVGLSITGLWNRRLGVGINFVRVSLVGILLVYVKELAIVVVVGGNAGIIHRVRYKDRVRSLESI